MILKKLNGMILITLTIMLTLLQSCDFDQVEDKYADYNSAFNDQLFEKGWIPLELAFNSMTDIYQRTNVDLNTCVFSFKLSKTDIETVKQKALLTKAIIEHPRRIDLPSEWVKTVNSLDKYILLLLDRTDSVRLAIDDQNGIIYGWRN